MEWIIESTEEYDEDGCGGFCKLYWNNELGWTDLENADLFSDLEKVSLSLPINGVWKEWK